MTAIDRLDAWLRISPSTVLPAEVMEYLDDVKAENEALRAERDEWHRVAESKQDIIDHMRDANANNTKLRELVHALDWCTENFDMPDKCEHCPLLQSDVLNPECEVRMRELGIEVPE